MFLDSRIGEFFGEVSTVVILTLVVSLVEALIILPAHIAHSKALVNESDEAVASKTGIDKFLYKLRFFNEKGDQFMSYMRDKLYTPTLKFVLKNQLLSLCVLLALFVLTISSIMGSVVGVTIFPNVASDTVSIELLMPEGTNPERTDSIITMVEDAAWVVNEDFTSRS